MVENCVPTSTTDLLKSCPSSKNGAESWIHAVTNELTGVKSREPSSSVALAAASMRSSHLFPNKRLGLLRSPRRAFLSPLLRFERSFDLLRSCFAILACWLRLVFLGLLVCPPRDIEELRCNGGNVLFRSGEVGRARLLGSRLGCS